jgi:hypothetical protein
VSDAEQVNILLPLLKNIALTCTDHEKIITIVFNLAKRAELYKIASDMIAEDLYKDHPALIEQKVIEFFDSAVGSALAPDSRPKIKLFFKLSRQNTKLMDHFVESYPEIPDEGIREMIMDRFQISLRKKLAVSEFLLEKL